MACFRPIQAYKAVSGKIVFKNPGSSIHLDLPCGRCVGCRIEQSQAWAVRCMHQSQMHDRNCVITLTYDDKHVGNSLRHRDFQLFMKRLRKRRFNDHISYFMCGEYGDKEARPHFHVMLFNYDFQDRKYFKESEAGSKLYTSEILDSLWEKGHCLVQDCCYEMAAYIAKYCTKKIGKESGSGDYEEVFHPITGEIYERRIEYGKMSNNPAIGEMWLRKYWKDITNTNTLVVSGREVKIPRFYKKWLKENKEVEFKDLQRFLRSQSDRYSSDTTVERLLVREECAKERIRNKVNRRQSND